MKNKEILLSKFIEEYNLTKEVKIVVNFESLQIYCKNIMNKWFCKAEFDIKSNKGYIVNSIDPRLEYKTLNGWKRAIEKRVYSEINWNVIEA